LHAERILIDLGKLLERIRNFCQEEFENRVPWRIFEPKRDEVTGGW
jgi:hypothetical protein